MESSHDGEMRTFMDKNGKVQLLEGKSLCSPVMLRRDDSVVFLKHLSSHTAVTLQSLSRPDFLRVWAAGIVTHTHSAVTCRITVITAIGTPVHSVAQLPSDLNSLPSQTCLNLPLFAV